MSSEMKAISPKDPKVQEFLEYIGAANCQWCRIEVEPNNIVGVTQGFGTEPPWREEVVSSKRLRVGEHTEALVVRCPDRMPVEAVEVIKQTVADALPGVNAPVIVLTAGMEIETVDRTSE